MIEEKKKKLTKPISYYFSPPPPEDVREQYTKEYVCEKYYKDVYKQAVRKVDVVEDAEDLTQEIFLFILTYYKDIDHRNLGGFLSAMATRAHLNWVRDSLKGMYDQRLVCSIDDENFYFRDPESLEHDPFLNYLKTNASLCMIRILDEVLPKPSAKIFLKVYGEGYTPAEVAAEYDYKLPAVYTKLHRIREMLGKCISEGVINKEDFL